jgi:hypothetical protein
MVSAAEAWVKRAGDSQESPLLPVPGVHVGQDVWIVLHRLLLTPGPLAPDPPGARGHSVNCHDPT